MLKVDLFTMIQAVSGSNEANRTESVSPTGIVGDEYLQEAGEGAMFYLVLEAAFEDECRLI
jgi:hypothetical protein